MGESKGGIGGRDILGKSQVCLEVLVRTPLEKQWTPRSFVKKVDDFKQTPPKHSCQTPPTHTQTFFFDLPISRTLMLTM